MPDETDLGPKPEPEIEPGEPNPGGADAISEVGEALPADLSTAENPAIDEDAAPDELQEGEDTSTEATDADAGEAGDQESGGSEEGNTE